MIHAIKKLDFLKTAMLFSAAACALALTACKVQLVGEDSSAQSSSQTTSTVSTPSTTPTVPVGWVWQKGSSTRNALGVYGTKGSAADANTPGARSYVRMNWTDSSGNLWLFGGNGYGQDAIGNLNDLWKFDVSTQQWTWMSGALNPNGAGNWGTQGVEATTNVPSARTSGTTAVDPSGNLWLYGGNGLDSTGLSGRLSDLWVYKPSTGMWTWIAGQNVRDLLHVTAGAPNEINPGRLTSASAWWDNSGVLYLFGGFAGATNFDWNSRLWSFRPATGLWTYLGESPGVSGRGVYGTKGVEAAGNWPGKRYMAVNWKDADGNFWVHGGEGTDVNGNEWVLNDLWRFRPSTGQWTWMSGSDVVSQSGVYTGTSTAVPGARNSAWGATDSDGKLWLFGGWGKASGGGDVGLDDLWSYDVGTGIWTWVHGNSAGGQLGTWGTQGVADAANRPSRRDGMLFWVDASGTKWLFGGQGPDSTNAGGQLNDLWSYR